MSFLTKLLRRSLSSRPIGVSKKSRPDLSFKESNELPNPYDVIDRNIPGIEQRLRLYEMRRLREQIELDRSDLEIIKKENENFETNHKVNNRKFQAELSYRVLTYFPGLSCPPKDSTDSSVSISVPIEYLNLSPSQINKIFNALGISDKNLKYLNYTVSDFPFISQNKTRAVEILEEIIKLAKSDENSDAIIRIKELNVKDDCITYKSYYDNEKNEIKSLSSKKRLEFPVEWLPAKPQIEENCN